MELGELLDHIGKELLDDRVEMLEGQSDTIWSDEVIVRYLNEAQRILARRAWVIEDTNPNSIDSDGSKVCQIQLVEGQTDYPFHKSILHIKSVRLSDSDLDLAPVGYNDNRILAGNPASNPAYFDINQMTVEDPGRPSRWSSDMGIRIIRLRAKPDATTAPLKVNFVVVRMPITRLAVNDRNASPEVPEEYHLDLALFAAGSALQHPDVDGRLRTIGKEWKNEFMAKVQFAEQDRLRRQQSEPQFRRGRWANDSWITGWTP